MQKRVLFSPVPPVLDDIIRLHTNGPDDASVIFQKVHCELSNYYVKAGLFDNFRLYLLNSGSSKSWVTVRNQYGCGTKKPTAGYVQDRYGWDLIVFAFLYDNDALDASFDFSRCTDSGDAEDRLKCIQQIAVDYRSGCYGIVQKAGIHILKTTAEVLEPTACLLGSASVITVLTIAYFLADLLPDIVLRMDA